MTKAAENLVIGVDLGGTTTAAALVDERLDVRETIEIPTPVSSQDDLIRGILELVRGLASRSPSVPLAVGFGIPSMIDQRRGRAVMSVNIPLADFDFAPFMKAELGMPVFIDNDANVAALAEARAGAAADASEVIMITLGTGIGGGIITGGRVYRGFTGSAAELGHMVIDVNGPRCQGACQNYGCFETMASATALERYAGEEAIALPQSALGTHAATGDRLDGALVSRLASEGDEAAGKAMARVGFYLGVGMTSLVNIFNPEFFVVGGGLSLAGDLIMEPAKKVLSERGLRPNRDVVKVVRASFGADSGLVGAACLAYSELETS